MLGFDLTVELVLDSVIYSTISASADSSSNAQGSAPICRRRQAALISNPMQPHWDRRICSNISVSVSTKDFFIGEAGDRP